MLHSQLLDPTALITLLLVHSMSGFLSSMARPHDDINMGCLVSLALLYIHLIHIFESHITSSSTYHCGCLAGHVKVRNTQLSREQTAMHTLSTTAPPSSPTCPPASSLSSDLLLSCSAGGRLPRNPPLDPPPTVPISPPLQALTSILPAAQSLATTSSAQHPAPALLHCHTP
ncbi:hypothetical protein V8C86DRAFT_1196633 [Haematococcus lacustris]